MSPDYFQTRFRSTASAWPEEFAIITAYATTGETWSDETNALADKTLGTELRKLHCWIERITGYSPTTGHAEPGWAVEMPLDAACEIGHRYRQDAIYYVAGGVVSVTRCDPLQRKLVTVGEFLDRVE